MENELILVAGAGAFGDGNHPTTRMALAAIDALVDVPRIACDMGCGAGLLALRMAQKFGCMVVAADLERSAVDAVKENAARNGITGILPIHSDGFRHADIVAHAPYDLMVMNILAEPLLQLAHDAVGHLAPEGILILSGIMVWQEAQIMQAYQALGLELLHRLTLGDWVCLVLAS